MKDGIIKKEYLLVKKEYALIRKELRILVNFKYPKIAGLLLTIIAAYFIFTNPSVSNYVISLNSWGYLGVFIAGLIFSFGFFAPFATGFFITLNSENILLAGLIGGFGAMLSNLLIFSMIRFSFADEFERLKKTETMKEISRLIDQTLSHKIKVYMMYALVGIIIASPLPNEAGAVLLAGIAKVKTSVLALISFVTSTIGILILLAL